LEYHTVQTLVKQWIGQNNCTTGAQHKLRHNMRSGSLGPNVNVLRQQEARRRQHHEQRRLKQCLQDAFNYTVDAESFKLRLKQSNQGHRTTWDRVKDDRSSHKDGPSRTYSRITRDVFNEFDDTDDDDEESANEDNDRPVVSTSESPLEDNNGSSKTPLTCLIYGDPHLRTLTQEFQTCRCLGAWPLIEHPLFAVQITNSRFKDKFQSTGITKVTVLIKEFGSCSLNTDYLYEVESNMHSSDQPEPLPITFIDGSTSSTNNLVQIVSSSPNLITLYVNHIGVRIHVSQSAESAYLNVVIKFDDTLSADERGQVVGAISAKSLCRAGCPSRERIEIKSLLQAIGMDVQSTNLNELSPELTSNSTSDPCAGMYGYYRLSCLYDVKMKGITHKDILVRKLMQEQDDTTVVKRSFVQSLKSDSFTANSSHMNKSFSDLCLLCLIIVTVKMRFS
jgi:hypothetical protein